MPDNIMKCLVPGLYEDMLDKLSNRFAGNHQTTINIARQTFTDISRIVFDAQSRNTWDSILSQAQAEGKIESLLQHAANEEGGSVMIDGLRTKIAYLPEVGQLKNMRGVSDVKNILLMYAKADTEEVTEIKNQLHIFKLTGQAEILDFHSIAAGNKEEEEKKMLADADIVLPVISSGFFTTPYLSYADAHVNQQKSLIPVLLKNCLWQRIKLLSRFVTVPSDGTFIFDYQNIDEGYAEVAKALDGVLNPPQ